MHRTIRGIIAAGAIAMSLATGTAEAQSSGWNVIRPVDCFLSVAANAQGQYVYTAYVYTDTYTVTIVDPVSINAAMQWCYNGSAFWGYYNGTPVWSMFWITPGMK
jgi:hypothetical protein